MKWVLILLSVIIVGCSSQPLSVGNSASSWQTYGQERAEKGHLIQSQNKLTKLTEPQQLTDEYYQAYLDGYQIGKEKYCSQSAYMLGRMGHPYRGICDDINPFFNNDYVNGKAAFL